VAAEPEKNLEVAERIGRMLDERKLPFVVIGAVALAAHRYIRFTEDIDLGVNADLRQMKGFVETLRSEGYDAVLHEPDAQDPLGGVIDVSGPFGLVQIISFEDRFPAVIRDALKGYDLRIFPGSMLRVVPIPQLVALKLYAGGRKSQADIIELLRRNPEVDRESLRQTCRKYRLRGLDELLKELD
jgi:hypothetical protein